MSNRRHSVSFETADADEARSKSPFQCAIDKYINERPKKSGTPKFIADLKASRESNTQADFHKAMIRLEKESSNKPATRIVRKVLQPVVQALSDYSFLIDQFADEDPLPTKLIWGSLKAVINCSKRFLQLYEKIEAQLKKVTALLNRLTLIEDLFGQSKNMQVLLVESYINVIRFWRRVVKECDHWVATRAGLSLFSINTTKLDHIVDDINVSTDEIDALVPVVQARIDKGERERASEERIQAGIARKQLSDAYDIALEKRRENRNKHVKAWLQPRTSHIFENNIKRHEEKLGQRTDGTCVWMMEHPTLQAWLAAQDKTARLWVRAVPGAGKSVACAYAIHHITKYKPEATQIYQYYSFDEEYTQVQVFRNLAVQLFEDLWQKTRDVPDDIYQYTQNSGSCLALEHAKTIFTLLVQKLDSIYIFLDGFDEECRSPSRRAAITETISFLSALTHPNLRLWFSSQDIEDLRTSFNDCYSIEICDKTNSDDIELYLAKRIEQLDGDEVDEGYRALILHDLRATACGCFLWVDLMLNEISDVSTLAEIHLRIKDGLPRLYEDYYKARLMRVHPSDRKFVTMVLSCITFARRPLKLSELREATATLEIDDGQAIDRTHQLLRKKLLRCCKPLIRFRETAGPDASAAVCVLSHSTVNRFLRRSTELFGPDGGVNHDRYCISEEAIGNVCLKYLFQPAYASRFRKHADTFVDGDERDIGDQPLLPYAAKYWEKHLDNLVEHQSEGGCGNHDSLCYRAKRFIHSPQFTTCLQVQSLLIQGQFQFWYDSGALWLGPQIKRALPHWLATKCLPTLQQDYAFFVGEWGYFLDSFSNATGPVAGEVDRCFWAALGPFHFLRDGASRYESFMLSTDHQPTHPELQYFDASNGANDEIVILKHEGPDKDPVVLRFECQVWKYNNGAFEWLRTQQLNVDAESYRQHIALSTQIADDASPLVSFDRDLGALRIGAKFYIKNGESVFEKAAVESQDIRMDTIAWQDGLLAVAGHKPSRSQLQEARKASTRTDPERFCEEPFAIPVNDDHAGSESSYSLDKSTMLSDMTSATSMSLLADARPSSAKNEAVGAEKGQQNEKPLKIAGIEVEEESEADSSDLGLDDDDFSSESDGNSAVMSWSEGSTRASSELDQAEDWNDWDDKDDPMNFDEVDYTGETENRDVAEVDLVDELNRRYNDSGGNSDEDSDGNSDGDGDEDEDDEDDESESEYSNDSGFDRNEDVEIEEEIPDDASLDSRFSFDSDTSGDDNSDSDDELGDPIGGIIDRRNGTRKTQRMYLRVYDTGTSTKKAIFHYSYDTRRRLYSSPPVFHPSKPLLVWPLGDEEVLFADVSSKTYFTRLLNRSTHNSCHVFIRTHFSSDGRHIHFAALEAETVSVPAERQQRRGVAQELRLNLQVTTHLLSERKTTRAPPRLLHRVNVPLGRAATLRVSDLPFELTWDTAELYVTRRELLLSVARVPLFPEPDATSSDPVTVEYIQQQIYLPRTALYRRVKFIPLADRTRNTAGMPMENRALVMLGSNSSDGRHRAQMPSVQVSPPIGVFLDEGKDLGGWRSRANQDLDDEERAQNKKRGAGKLADLFERFDKNEDCDIVPYLY